MANYKTAVAEENNKQKQEKRKAQENKTKAKNYDNI
jgi:hypothetical protein